MAKMYFGAENCRSATSELTGKKYTADRQGFIHVDDPRDAKFLQSGGYLVAGGMPRLAKYWVCDCGWEASINSCPRCPNSDLTKVER